MSGEFWLPAIPLKRHRGLWLGAAALVALGWWWSAAGHAGSASSVPAKNPVRIQSEQLVADMDCNTAEFSGQVRVESDAYTITADRLTIEFKPAAAGRNRLEAAISAKDISRIIARGAVRIRTDILTAGADEAVYEPDVDQLRLMAREGWPPAGSGKKDRRSATPLPQGSSSAGTPAPERVRVTVLPSSGAN